MGIELLTPVPQSSHEEARAQDEEHVAEDDPAMLARTSSVSPCRSAITVMISSAAFPIVTFRSPPTRGPRCDATSSVPFPISADSGNSAAAESAKTTVLLAPSSFATTAMGMSASRA